MGGATTCVRRTMYSTSIAGLRIGGRFEWHCSSQQFLMAGSGLATMQILGRMDFVCMAPQQERQPLVYPSSFRRCGQLVSLQISKWM